mmetsp:Transcript_45398/g.128098  ORF Transcript_45398/g.128098 Transcript_45398/m.128098 type:complete len:226 (+) Transcript_45398:1248-1925(+)
MRQLGRRIEPTTTLQTVKHLFVNVFCEEVDVDILHSFCVVLKTLTKAILNRVAVISITQPDRTSLLEELVELDEDVVHAAVLVLDVNTRRPQRGQLSSHRLNLLGEFPLDVLHELVHVDDLYVGDALDERRDAPLFTEQLAQVRMPLEEGRLLLLSVNVQDDLIWLSVAEGDALELLAADLVLALLDGLEEMTTLLAGLDLVGFGDDHNGPMALRVNVLGQLDGL